MGFVAAASLSVAMPEKTLAKFGVESELVEHPERGVALTDASPRIV